MPYEIICVSQKTGTRCTKLIKKLFQDEIANHPAISPHLFTFVYIWVTEKGELQITYSSETICMMQKMSMQYLL